MISVHNTGCHLIYQYVQCNNVQSACATNCNEAQTGYKTCSLVRNYFVIKDNAWDYEDTNHESCSIMARGDKMGGKI